MTDDTEGGTKKGPVERFRHGSVNASIWQNASGETTFHTAQFENRYKDKDGQWQTSKGEGLTDILFGIQARQEAYTRILARERAKSTNKRDPA